MKNDELEEVIPVKNIEKSIYYIRGHKVILDQDLALLYGVDTGSFNRSIVRNKERFPEDFAFRITEKEWANLKCQIGIARSKWGGRRNLPMVFTEHGVAMAANLLKSQQAVKISVEIVRTFIKLREFLHFQEDVVKELDEIKSYMIKNSHKTDREFRRVWTAIEKLTEPKHVPSKPEGKEERKIGFDLNQ